MSYKAIAMAHELADALKKRLSSLALSEGFDTNGNPTISIGSGVAGAENAFIRIMPITWSNVKNIIGSAQEVYTPHVIQLATEKNFAGTTDNIADILADGTILALFGEVLTRGRVEWYKSTNGTAPTVSTLGGTAVATFDSLYWPLVSSQ